MATLAIKASNLVGTTEIARLFGVRRSAVTNWYNRHMDFPDPVANFSMGPVFDVRAVKRWARKHGKEAA